MSSTTSTRRPAFYSELFGVEPATTRPGYAHSAIIDPPLKLVLLENPGQGGSLNHLGIEVPSVDEVDTTQTRLAEHGLASIDERGTTCRYAKRDKFWIEGSPSGGRWEVYTVPADGQTFFGESAEDPACCGGGTAQETAAESGEPAVTTRCR